ncbi:DNA methyltransferase [Salinarimonas sp.]|uniref:DNA methyltransferase n=1 Tax=Salinarimonas sp. TaxID=2766526 RepID=UPI0032D929DA
MPTIIEPLREDWESAQADATAKLLAGDARGARTAVKRFHDRLCDTIVLDPACGTGNFLYVALELMKRLEGEVLDFLKLLGETAEPLRTVDPHQFLGIEKNPRAVPIAELVLWIGYIQWWFRTRERTVMTEPILKDFGMIREGDAVLEHDGEEIVRDAQGRPVTRHDPNARKLHPVTGELVPDPEARIPVTRFENPRPARWPEADFIVGNPPFIGKGEDMRTQLGDGYVHALWASRKKKSDSVDFVMYWWEQAASILALENSRLRRFGFITTNSVTQTFSRRIIEQYASTGKASLIFAVADHPWIKVPKGIRGRRARKAAVRIAMTVAERGYRTGKILTVSTEENLDSDNPTLGIRVDFGYINSDLSIGPDLGSISKLNAAKELALNGVLLAGKGFVLEPPQARALIAASHENIVRPYVDGRELVTRPLGRYVIDAFGLD